jgi:chorismate dehydratase
MSIVRLGAVEYLNTKPLVYGLERDARFAIRYDVPARCAALLHEGAVDLGLIPSIEYLRGPVRYRIVPGLAIASRGPVASVAMYTRRDPREIRSIAMDTSSRTSVALVTVILSRVFDVRPDPLPASPDLDSMLERADAALIIGDNALLLDHAAAGVQKVDLGEEWTRATALPFVYAFWAGRDGAVTADHVAAMQQALAEGVERPDEIGRAYFPGEPERQQIAARYLRDNIKYALGAEERAGLELFYRYAAELGLVESAGELRFFESRP